MGSESRQKQKAARMDPEAPPNPVWLAMVWGRVVGGLGLAAAAGVVFGHAWTKENTSLWWVGGITLLAGVLLVLSGLFARRGSVAVRTEAVSPGTGEEPQEPQEPLVPLLGALLLYKYQVISVRQLNDALEQQRKGKRLLGEILLEMGAITQAELNEALRHQQEVARQKRGKVEQ